MGSALGIKKDDALASDEKVRAVADVLADYEVLTRLPDGTLRVANSFTELLLRHRFEIADGGG